MAVFFVEFTVEGSPLERGGGSITQIAGFSLEGMVRHVMDGPDSMFRWMVPGVGSAWICFCTVALAFYEFVSLVFGGVGVAVDDCLGSPGCWVVWCEGRVVLRGEGVA